jgi:hypothetical protein
MVAFEARGMVGEFAGMDVTGSTSQYLASSSVCYEIRHVVLAGRCERYDPAADWATCDLMKGGQSGR